MLIPDKFKRYCATINNNMDAAVKYALAMNKKYAHIFKSQEQILRQRFTTNTQDDYTSIPWTSAPLNVQPFADMARLIIHQNLIPNFFKKETLDAIRQADPQHYDGLCDRAPITYLHSLLVWGTFDEGAYLQQMDWRKQEEARIHAAAEQYKRHQMTVQTGKREVAKIVKDPYLTDRFFLGAAAADRKTAATEQVTKIAHTPFLLKRFVNTSITKL